MKFSHAIAVLACVAAVVLAQSGGTVSIVKYRDFNCTGPVEHNYTIPEGQCTNTNGREGIESLTVSCGAPVAKSCVTVIYDAGVNCADKSHVFTAPCDQCQAGPREVGHYIYRCNQRAKTVTAGRGCDSTCSNCNETNTLNVGVCQPIRNGTDSVLFSAFVSCPNMVTETTYRQQNCSGTADHTWKFAEASCDAGWVFTCSNGVAAKVHERRALRHGKHHERIAKPYHGRH